MYICKQNVKLVFASNVLEASVPGIFLDSIYGGLEMPHPIPDLSQAFLDETSQNKVGFTSNTDTYPVHLSRQFNTGTQNDGMYQVSHDIFSTSVHQISKSICKEQNLDNIFQALAILEDDVRLCISFNFKFSPSWIYNYINGANLPMKLVQENPHWHYRGFLPPLCFNELVEDSYHESGKQGQPNILRLRGGVLPLSTFKHTYF